MKGLMLLCLLGRCVAYIPPYTWNGPGEPNDDFNSENVCVSDSETCGCCLMQKQMLRMERYFSVSLDELQMGLEKAQAALNSVQSSYSAFSVALTDTRRCPISTREDMVLKYQSVFLNLGGSYNVSTGIFTAPRSGVYVLALTVYSDAGVPGALLAACVRLRKNSRVLASLSEYNTQDQEDSATTVLAVQLKSGDKVDVILPATCSLCDDSNHYNTFSGFLLYAID